MDVIGALGFVRAIDGAGRAVTLGPVEDESPAGFEGEGRVEPMTTRTTAGFLERERFSILEAADAALRRAHARHYESAGEGEVPAPPRRRSSTTSCRR